MRVTVPQLDGWQPEALEEAGRELQRMAATAGDLAARFSSLVQGELGGVWEGPAADAAAQRVAWQRQDLEGAALALHATGAVLLAAATAIGEAQATLRRARLAAQAAGVELADDGTVNPTRPATATGEQAAAEAAWLAGEALRAAEEADRDAARALARVPEVTALLGGPRAGIVAALLPLLPAAAVQALVEAGLVSGILLGEPPPGRDPYEVARWWRSLPPAQQRLQVHLRPELIGSLEGVPAAARHQANMLLLQRELAKVDGELARVRAERDRLGYAPPELAAKLDELERRLAMLRSVATVMAQRKDYQLLLLDPVLPGRAAIAIGDVDRAEHVAVVVPGLEQDVTQELGNIVSNAERLWRTAVAYGRRDNVPSEGIATVAWIGYETPSFATVPFTGHAERGAEHLRATLHGLEAVRQADPAAKPLHLSVHGHSYGSLTTGIAVRERTPADDVVLIGSPGVGAQHASELAIGREHVFIGEAERDAVADFQHFGTDPSSSRFGGRQFQTDGGIDPLTGELLLPSKGHSEYFDLRTESVRNMALVMLGRSDLVTYGNMSGLGDAVAGGPFYGFYEEDW